jgi:hypothetical protein
MRLCSVNLVGGCHHQTIQWLISCCFAFRNSQFTESQFSWLLSKFHSPLAAEMSSNHDRSSVSDILLSVLVASDLKKIDLNGNDEKSNNELRWRPLYGNPGQDSTDLSTRFSVSFAHC